MTTSPTAATADTNEAAAAPQRTAAANQLNGRENTSPPADGKRRIGDTVLAAALIPAILNDFKVRIERRRA